uniref:Uncharacterized protein n=1 Tax=Anguilla anguilla TaxID=7936 RepID=A0A0E9XIS7_ANGAN
MPEITNRKTPSPSPWRTPMQTSSHYCGSPR